MFYYDDFTVPRSMQLVMIWTMGHAIVCNKNNETPLMVGMVSQTVTLFSFLHTMANKDRYICFSFCLFKVVFDKISVNGKERYLPLF